MNGQRIPYPTLAGALVASVNALATSAQVPVSGGGGTGWTLHPAAGHAAGQRRLTLGVRLGGSPARVHLDAAALATVLGDLLPADAFEALDGDLRAAVLAAALARPLAALTEALRAEIVLEDVPSGPGVDAPADPPPESVRLEVRGPADAVRCTVEVELQGPLPAPVLETLGQYTARRDCGAVPVPVTFELGSSRLSEAELASVEPGDIVLFDECHLADGRLRVNVCDRWFVTGALTGFDLTIEEERR